MSGRGPAGADPIHRWLASGAPTPPAISCSWDGTMGSNVGHLWVNRGGRPCAARRSGSRSSCARRRQVSGRHAWPHLFQDCAVTQAGRLRARADRHRTRPALATPTSTRPRSTYIQVVGMKAHAKVQEVIAAPASRSRQAGGIEVPDKAPLGLSPWPCLNPATVFVCRPAWERPVRPCHDALMSAPCTSPVINPSHGHVAS